MPVASRRSIVAFWLVLALARQTYAQELCLLEAPSIDVSPAPTASDSDLDDVLVISARRIGVGADSAAEFSDEVQFEYRDCAVTAQSARRFADGNVDMLGRINVECPDVTIFGEDAHFDTDAETISFAGAGFDLPKRPARGSAEQIELTSESRLSLTNVMFTTCPPENVAWELSARDIDLDANTGVGKARGVKLEFKGVPVLYSPYLSFPIDDQRKSGFLTPDVSSRDRTGRDLVVPYYLNLAPNLDLTLDPRYMSKRGTQLGSDFRYLLRNSRGEFGFEYLPDDDETLATRRYANLQHESLFGTRDQFQVLAGLEEVSDDTYFEDLGTSLSVTSQTHLNRFVDLNFFAPNWSLLTRFQNYQTIDPVLTDLERPYERVPQILFGGRWGERLVTLDSSTEIVNFDRNVGTTGWRLDSTQELSLKFARPGMFLTPAIAVRQTNYWIDDPLPGEDDMLTRGLPIGSLDMGLKLEREKTRGRRSWVQTIEPRLLYVRVPFEDQSNLPVFDTILPDFNLVQLFRKYQFVGPDRIADTDQLSFGVTTRLVDAANGRERLTATLGQTRYRDAQSVTLPGVTPTDTDASDYVAEVAIGIRDAWAVDLGYQWNSETSSTARTETRLEFRPKEDRLFGFGYRYRRDALEQGDVSLVWPVSQRWRIIGRYSYSFLDKERLEDFVGWEYEACCWRLRMVNRNYVSRRTGETDSSISLQLELKGLSQRVTAPDDLLDRGILGYRNIARAY
ncbi:MAG TPA: LPS assembly protein LptD [Gammaproteobacteria bacterium]|nr:LPS assembly protein LptD [Gammaproteobacteria bacterium]